MEKVYADPATSTKSPSLLAKRTNEIYSTNYTPAQAKKFLSSQSSYEINKKHIKPNAEDFAPTGAPVGHWQSDVIYFDLLKGKNDMQKAILTVLNTTTRYVYARGLISNKSSDVSKALDDILTEMKKDNKHINTLRVDGGSEFKGVTAELLKSKGITIDTTEPYTHARLSRTDRFHRTLRQKFGDSFEKTKSNKWVDKLPAIIKNINNTPHETLTEILNRSASPNSVTPEEENIIRTYELKQASKIQLKTDKLNDKIHLNRTRCRLLVSNTKAGILERFSKSQRNVWTRDTYLISGRNGVNSWNVDVPNGEVSIWPTHSIKILSLDESDKINDKILEDETMKRLPDKSDMVNLKVASAQRMEDRNISPDERAAALVAPARAKRTTRVNYKALASGELSNSRT